MILVIGYGNPLRGDDGVAWRIVAALADALPQVSAHALHQLTPEWAEPISRAEAVVFVDAVAGGQPGQVECFGLNEEAGNLPAPQPIGSHLTTPEGLLAMAAELFGRRPAACMVTIVGESFEVSESLSPTVEAAVPVAVSRIVALAGQFSGAALEPCSA
jgi:hydrogenase maturation protease